MSAFALRLADLKPGANRVRLEAPASALGLDPETWPEALTLDLTIDRMGESFALRGRASTRSHEECARCLKAIEVPREFEFQAFAERASAHGGSQDDAQDGYVLRHDGRVLVLDEEVREQALLARPMTTLCREDCPGLCPRCGGDRSEGTCRCVQETQPAH
ncbi:MAG TPA: DUF177 domain-containing protein [Candidatus Eisenbacteria bacterium]|nr:DUF177 domain-containing protein [Candidatus Eisenbacteria bacterium]